MNKSDSHADHKRKDELFKKYVIPNYEFVSWLCRHYTLSRQDVDDNLNDVLINIYRYIETYDESRDIRKWLSAVTKRRVLSNERKKKMHNDFFPLVESVCDDSRYMGNESYSEDNEGYSDVVVKALESLPEIHRKTFMMQISGMSLKEIASELQKCGDLKSGNISSVSARIFTAKKMLRKYMEKNGYYNYTKKEDATWKRMKVER